MFFCYFSDTESNNLASWILQWINEENPTASTLICAIHSNDLSLSGLTIYGDALQLLFSFPRSLYLLPSILYTSDYSMVTVENVFIEDMTCNVNGGLFLLTTESTGTFVNVSLSRINTQFLFSDGFKTIEEEKDQAYAVFNCL